MMCYFFRTVHFQLHFPAQNCNTINELYEGVEFSIRLNNTNTWIPLHFISPSQGTLNKNLVVRDSNSGNFTIRGYAVDNSTMAEGGAVSSIICFNEQVAPASVEFRWLQTSSFRNTDNTPKDVWSIDDVMIRYGGVEYNDTFEDLK